MPNFESILAPPLLVLLLSLVLAPASSIADDPDDPHELVQQTADELIAVIEEGQTYYEDDPERFHQAVLEVLEPVVDFDGFARSVMAAHFRDATPEQRRQFSDSFKESLISTYGRALLQFDNQEVRVVRDDRPPQYEDRRSVRMEFETRDGRVYPVTYTMVRGDEGRWRMRNIIVDGINIGLTYRNQFQSAVRSRGDLAAVIDEWDERIAEDDPVATELEEEARE